MSSLYIHIPFCAVRCGYCDFFSTVCGRVDEGYLAAAEREMELRRGFAPGDALSTIYLGGGTPSLLAPGQVGHLLSAARRGWDCSALAEVTLEANPDDLSKEYLAALRAAGVNRLSVGVQSLDDGVLRFAGRRHTASAAVKAIRQVREAGFDNISIDLMYGIPGMDSGVWRRTLRGALALRPEHISAYCLSVEPGTPFAARGVLPSDEALCAAQYDTLCRTLAGEGYEHYEISNFALPGRRSRHNSAYWSGAPYLGVGPSAHSYDGARTRSWNAQTLGEYLLAPRHESETLSDTDLLNELLMTRLRTTEGVDAARFATRFGDGAAEALRRRAAKHLETGALEFEGGKYRIVEKKWFVCDDIICSLFDK